MSIFRKHHDINIRVVAAEFFTILLLLVLLVLTIISKTRADAIAYALILASIIILGSFSIHSIIRESIMRREVKKITLDLEIMKRDLQRLDAAKSDFISIASHQLRTPLSTIKGYISMIQEGTFGQLPTKLQDPLYKVYVSNERLITLVSDLLDLSRMERGKMRYDFIPIRLGDIAEGVVNDFKIVAKSKNMSFDFKRITTNDLVWGDPDKLRQVILNLVDNAFKYTPSGSVTVSLVGGDKNVQISVADTGLGLDAEELRALFQKFSRGRDQGRSHTEGRGLGLYVARLIAEAHRGALTVSSSGKWKGSTFSFTLPVYEESQKKSKIS